MTTKKPFLRFSIIIPLEFHRGQIEACLQRWTREQTYPRDCYEILAAGCPHSLNEEALSSIRQELGPNDRLLLYDQPHDISLCAWAAKDAKEQVLIFTESHCLPDPNALSMTNNMLQLHPEWAGFSGSTTRVIHDRLSIVEADMYEADIRFGMEEHPWLKLLDQYFVVRAENYHAAGGFRAELGHFAEWHLAARMHQKGYQIGYAPEIQVKHYYSGSLHELIEFTRDFTRGEMTFHSEFRDDPCRSYFEEPTEWLNRYRWLPTFAHLTFRLAWQARSRSIRASLRPDEIFGRYRLLLKSGLRVHYSLNSAVTQALIRFLIAFWTLRLSLLIGVGRRPLLSIFLRLIGATIKLERIRFVHKWLEQNATQDKLTHTTTPATSLIWQPENSYAFRSVGFHGVEEWNGQKFRWSEPVGTIEVSLLPGNYCFAIQWLPIKKVENLIVYINEKPIPITQESCKASSLSFQVDSTHPLQFSWTCEPRISLKGPGLLGLPVCSISWTPVSDIKPLLAGEKNQDHGS